MQPNQPNNQLDPQAVALAKAIKRAETGGHADAYNAKGASGETGAYQFMPNTWSQWAGKHLKNAQAEYTVENQNRVAYSQIKEWKDAGYNPAQIASLWNSGDPNSYKGTRSDGKTSTVGRIKNSAGVEVDIDVPSYAKKVSQYYREVAGGVPTAQAATGPAQQATNPIGVRTSPAPETEPVQANLPQSEAAPEQKKSFSERVADTLGYGKTVDTIGSLIARGRATDQERQYIEEPTGKEVAGAAINVGSLLGGGAGLMKAGAKLGAGKLFGSLGTGAISGALGFGGAGMAQGLEENASAGDIAKKTALYGAGGAVAGAAVPVVGALGSLLPATLRSTKNVATKTLQGAENVVAEQAAIRALPPVEREVVRSGLPQNVLDFKNTTPATQKSLQDMLSIHKRGVADPLYADKVMRAQQVPAQTFIKYAEEIQNNSNKVAGELKAIAAKNPTEQIDFSPAIQTYIDQLAGKGIRYNPKTGRFISDGKVPSSEMKYYDDIMREIVAVTKDSPSLTRMQAHTLRQRLFATLDSATRQGGKPGQRPFSVEVDNDVQALRRALAEQLGPEYQEAAQRYAQNEAFLSQVAKKLGVPIDEIPFKDRKLSQILMRNMSNADADYRELIEDLYATAQANGIKADTDIYTQLRFADMLDSLYGSTQTRTLRGQTARGVADASGEIIPDLMAGQTSIPQALMRGARDLSGKGESDQARALEAFISELNKNKGLVPLP